MKGKIIAVFIILLLTLIAFAIGGQLAGAAFLLGKLGLDPMTARPMTLIQYHQAYGGIGGPVGRYIQMATAIALAPVGAVLIMGLVLLATKKGLIDRLYGDARWARDHEIRRVNMFLDEKKNSDAQWPPVLLGRKGKELIADYSQEYTSLAAPPGSGKGVGFVVPNLLFYPHSVLNFDPKLENFNITSGYRSKVLGQEVYLFSPDNEEFKTHCWNPLDYISTDPVKRWQTLKTYPPY